MSYYGTEVHNPHIMAFVLINHFLRVANLQVLSSPKLVLIMEDFFYSCLRNTSLRALLCQVPPVLVTASQCVWLRHTQVINRHVIEPRSVNRSKASLRA